MKTTANYGLKKPDITDYYNVEDQNYNSNILDAQLKVIENSVSSHSSNKSNPHRVTKNQIGLGDVDNTSDANKPISTATQAELDKKALASDLTAHTGNKSNPHGVTKGQVGLGNVPNVATNDQTPTYTTASANTALTSGEKLTVAMGKIAKAVSSLISHLADTTAHITSTERTTWNGKASGTHTHTKSQVTDFPTSLPASDVYSWAKASTKPSYTKSEVGLGNVDNTADSVKSVKYATSAGNADTVDGHHADDFVMLVDYGTRLIGMEEALDFNDLIATKRYAFNISSIKYATNPPENTNGILYVTNGGTYIQQEFVTMANEVYRRCNNGSDWSSWEKWLSTDDSAPVVIGTTAPTNTGTLWVDTSAMKVKIYKNNAWTALT